MKQINTPSTPDMPAQHTVNGVRINADLTASPLLVDGSDTMVKLFRQRCESMGKKTAHREKVLGIWQSSSWQDYYHRARLIGLALHELGLQRGDVVSILSEDSREWLYTDLGVQCMGGIVSGIYTTDSASQLEYLINDSASRFLFVENEEQLDKYLSVRAGMPGLKKVILYDAYGLHGFQDDAVLHLDALYALGETVLAREAGRFELAIEASRPEDIALLIYTSGTTGKPKGVALSHRNILFCMSVTQSIIEVKPGDEQLCFLPLSHVYERMTSTFLPIVSRAVVNFTESPETVFDNVREVSPSTFAGVPRIYEKIYSRVQALVSDGTSLGQWAYRQAVQAGLQRLEAQQSGQLTMGLRLRYRCWDWLVLRNVRRMLGFDRVRRAATGAAPIAPDLMKWFHAIGVPLYEGYGMSETTALVTANYAGANRFGSVGLIPEGTQIRIDDSGEILVKSAGVFSRYWNNPEATRATFTADGWLKTGDAGRLDDGYLSITGRIKDIIITAGGKNIAPAEIENQLKFSPYISDAVVIGDKRKYLTCLIMIDQENVEKFAQDQRVPFSDFTSLCKTAAVQELIRKVVETVNQSFARVEQIKDFRLITVLLSAEDEELTATMKLKRSLVERKYALLIDEMYP